MSNLTTTAQVDNVTVTELDSIQFWNLDGELVFVLDELQSCSISNTEETVDVTGKKGRKIDKLKRNKAVTITGANGLVSAGMISQQTGGVYEYLEEAEVAWDETIVLDDPTMAVLSYEAVGVTGAEIKCVVKESAGGTLDTLSQLKQGATAAAGVFTYDPLTRTLGFAEGEFMEGDTIRVYYDIVTKVAHVDNPADTFSQMGRLVIDCTVRDKCGKEYHGQYDVPKADFSGNFTMDLGQDQTVHNFEIEALASVGNCEGNTAGRKSIYWDFKVFGVEGLEVSEDEEPVTPPVTNPDPENPGSETGDGNDGNEGDGDGDDNTEKPATGGEGSEGDGEDENPPATVDKSELDAYVNEVGPKLEDGTWSVSTAGDGTDVAEDAIWFTTDDWNDIVMEKFGAACTAAGALLQKADATQEEVDEALAKVKSTYAEVEAVMHVGPLTD